MGVDQGRQSVSRFWIRRCLPGLCDPTGQRGDQLGQPAGLPAMGRGGLGGTTAAVCGGENLYAAYQRQD
ncbi:hypothetical protein D3C87_1799300 [compost metagenome]